MEPIRQTVVRIVLWFEEIYMFNSMSNILYKHLGLIVFRGELTKENYKFRFLSFSNLDGREGGVSVLGYATNNCFERATENTGATEIASGTTNVNQRRGRFLTEKE